MSECDCSNKTLFTEIGGEQDLGCKLLFVNPSSRTYKKSLCTNKKNLGHSMENQTKDINKP